MDDPEGGFMEYIEEIQEQVILVGVQLDENDNIIVLIQLNANQNHLLLYFFNIFHKSSFRIIHKLTFSYFSI